MVFAINMIMFTRFLPFSNIKARIVWYCKWLSLKVQSVLSWFCYKSNDFRLFVVKNAIVLFKSNLLQPSNVLPTLLFFSASVLSIPTTSVWCCVCQRRRPQKHVSVSKSSVPATIGVDSSTQWRRHEWIYSAADQIKNSSWCINTKGV